MLQHSFRSASRLLLELQPAVRRIGTVANTGANASAGAGARGTQSQSRGSLFTWRQAPPPPLFSPGRSVAKPRLSLFSSPSPPSAPARRSFHSSQSQRSTHSQSSRKRAGEREAETKTETEAEPHSLSARLKKLSREYGWATIGVYLGLSLLDFPFCFLLVRTVGTDKIAEAEHFVVSRVKAVIPENVKETWRSYRGTPAKTAPESSEASAEQPEDGWGVKEADERNKHEASLATQLALAYAIHKSFIFVRVPLTAAVTPKVVKLLRSWGWKIGKQRPAT